MCAVPLLCALSLGLSGQCDSQFHSAAAAVWTGHHAFFIILASERFQESLVTIEAHEFAVRHKSPPLSVKSGNTYATPRTLALSPGDSEIAKRLTTQPGYLFYQNTAALR